MEEMASRERPPLGKVLEQAPPHKRPPLAKPRCPPTEVPLEMTPMDHVPIRMSDDYWLGYLAAVQHADEAAQRTRWFFSEEHARGRDGRVDTGG